MKRGGGVTADGSVLGCHCYYCCNTLCEEITISDYFVINKHKKRAKHTPTRPMMQADTLPTHKLIDNGSTQLENAWHLLTEVWLNRIGNTVSSLGVRF